MQNDNHRNILLFLILVVLIVIAFLIARNDRNVVMAPTGTLSTNQIYSNQDLLDEEDLSVPEPAPAPTPEDPTVTFLKGLVSDYPYAEIKECNWADGRQFTFYKDRRISDMMITIYNPDGTVIDMCPTFNIDNTNVSGICQAMEGCGDVVYGFMKTGGYNADGTPKGYTIDTYNLD